MTPEQLVPLSEYHRLPQEAKASDFYKRLLEVVCTNATLALFIMDEHQHCVYMNPAAERLTGYSLDETAGRTLHQVIHHTRPDGRPYPLCECPIDQAFPQNNREQGEEVFVHKDGHFYPVAYTASPIREGSRTTGTIIEVRDITQEKLAEQRRQEMLSHEQALRTKAETAQRQITDLLEYMTDAFVAFDRNWCYTYANPAAIQLLQKPAVDLIGKNVWEEVFPSEAGGLAYQKLHQALEQQVSVAWEEFGQPLQRWLDIRAYPSAGGVAVYFQDITERKQTEAALRQSEERLRIALASSPITLFTQDQELRYSWVYNPSPEFADFDLVGKRDADILAAEEAERLSRIKHRVLKTGVGLREEVQTTVNGQTLYHDLTVEPLHSSEGEIVGLTCAAMDITQLKQTELALRQSETILNAFIASSPVGMAFIDCNWRYIYANEALAVINGIPLSEHFGRTLKELLPQWAPTVEPILQQVVQTKTPLLNQELVGATYPADRLRHCLVNYFPVCLESGEVIGIGITGLDITDRRLTEEALRQSEEKFRLAVTAARMVAWSWNAQSDRIVRSETACDILGLPPTALSSSGTDGWNLVHPEDLAEHQAKVAAAVDSWGSYRSECRMVRPDNGAIIWVEDRGQVTCDSQGNIISIEGVLFDITARKQIEASLRESEEKYRTLFESIDEGFCIVEVIFDDHEKPIDYRFLNVNPAFEKQTTLASVVGKTVRDVVAQPEDQWFERYGQVALTGEPIRVEACPEGFNGWYEMHAFRLGDPHLRRVGILFNNITERKQAEEELRQKNAILNVINESTPTPIFVKDRQGRFIYANPATLTVLGSAVDEVIGYRDCDLYPHLEDAVRVMENDRRIMESGQMEVVEESPDGIRTFLGMKVPYRDERGEVIGLIGISNDISERVQIERDREWVLQQEQAAREVAEEANRIKDEFLAVLSHEMRSPLNPILGWSRLLQTGSLDQATTQRALATIERNAKLQAELIEDLLDVSRILRGKLSLTVRPVNPVAVVSAAIETVRLAAEAKPIQIEVQQAANVGLIAGDSTRLQQVVWNLLSNAVKFTPPGGRVEVKLERREVLEGSDEGADTPGYRQFAQLVIRDTGKGISASFLPYVFDYFRQADGATTRKFGGLGLGLAIVRHLVELHGGTIQAESPGEGLGATFTVSLPLMAEPLTAEQTPSPAASTLSLQGVRVLVVDDESDNRGFVEFLLKQAGAEVLATASAEVALVALGQFLPDVLLSDIGMPDMDGYMLMREIRALPPDQGGSIPAIALTAYAGEIDYQQALAAGFQQHLAKPVDPRGLIQSITELTAKGQRQS